MPPIVQQLEPEEKNYLEILAHLQLSYGKTREAIVLYRALSRDPQLKPRALNALATAYLVENNHAQALATAQESLPLQADAQGRQLAFTLISRSAYLIGDTQAAQDALTQSLTPS